MSRTENFQRCLRAFLARNYAACVQEAGLMLVDASGREVFPLVQLVLMCFQRLGETGQAEKLGAKVLKAAGKHPWELDPWQLALVRVTLGRTDPAEVIRQAKQAGDEVQLCQALYYAAMRHSFTGRQEEAAAAFEACLAVAARVQCLEADLARAGALDEDEPEFEREDYHQCLAAFRERRYIDFIKQVRPIVARELAASGQLDLFLVRLNLVCLQRLGQADEVQQLSGLLLAASEDQPWDNALVRLLLGQADVDEVLSLAQSDAQRCRTYYYGAARLLTDGRLDEARALLAVCLSCPSACGERQLAEAEVESLAAEPLAEELLFQVTQLHEQGQAEQAVAVAARAWDLVRQHGSPEKPSYLLTLHLLANLLRQRRDYAAALPLAYHALEVRRRLQGDRHPDFAASLHDLAFDLQKTGRHDEAEQFLQQALEVLRTTAEDNSSLRVSCLNSLATLYGTKGAFDLAEPLLREVVAIQRTRPEEKDALLGGLKALAAAYRRMGKHRQAEAHEHEASEVRRAGWSPPDNRTQAAQQCVEAFTEGDYESCFLQGVKILETEVSYQMSQLALISAQRLNSPADILDGVGSHALGRDGENTWAGKLLLLTLGRLDPAEVLRQAETDEQRCQAQCYWGTLLVTEGDLDAARKALSACVALNVHCLECLLAPHELRALDTRSEQLTALAAARQVVRLLEQGRELHEQGRTEDALTFALQARDLARRHRGEDHQDFAVTLSVLGELSTALGDQGAAEPLLRQALTVFGAAGKESSPGPATRLNNLAELYRTRRERAVADPVIRRQADCLQDQWKTGPPLAQLVDVFRARWTISPHQASTLTKLAHVQVRLGRPTDALHLLLEAEESLDQLIGQAFSVASESGRAAYVRDLLANTSTFLSLVLQHLPDSPAAVRAGLDLVLRRKALGAETLAILRDVVRDGKHPDLEARFEQLFAKRRQIAQDAIDGPATDERASYQQFAAQCDELDLSDKEAAMQSLPYRHFLALWEDIGMPEGFDPWAAFCRSWNDLPREGPSMTEQADAFARFVHQDLLVEATVEKEELEVALVRAVSEMDLPQRLRAADRHAVARALPEQAALVEFVHFDALDFAARPGRGEPRWRPARYAAFVLPAGDPDAVRLIDLGDAESIDHLVAVFRSAVTGEAERRAGRELGLLPPSAEDAREADAGTRLRRAVFDPLRQALEGRTRLLLAPDGELSRLPFEVLPAEDGQHLLDHYRISYVATGRDVLRFGSTAAARQTASVVVAAPDFDLSGADAVGDRSSSEESPWNRSRDQDQAGLHFGPLPGTQAEGERIAALLGVEPWLSARALEKRLKTCRSPRILHLATHGFFLHDQRYDANAEQRDLGTAGLGRLSRAALENPLLRSGLTLTGVNTWLSRGPLPAEAEDGILTAEDVTGMDLLDTELVVLSACETGLGQVQIGEGVFGLRRAFAVAGARTLVMSLWKVPDEQTQELMEDFYQRILRGEPRAEALRLAQQAVRARSPDPFCWGAFICQGDPGSMPQSTTERLAPGRQQTEEPERSGQPR